MITVMSCAFWGLAYAIVGRLVLDIAAYEFREFRRRSGMSD
ncbi:hypothetical protein [Nocardia salmonicida]